MLCCAWGGPLRPLPVCGTQTHLQRSTHIVRCAVWLCTAFGLLALQFGTRAPVLQASKQAGMGRDGTGSCA